MKLSHRIRQLRYAKGWGPDDLASRANISRTALYQIESGKTGLPRAATLRRIARALGVAPENLLSDQEAADVVVPVVSEPAADVEMPQPTAWLRDFELERKFRILLSSPLRDAMARIVEETFRLLPSNSRDLTV
jgi:transcriptional regulator with XRE-family HTH domain